MGWVRFEDTGTICKNQLYFYIYISIKQSNNNIKKIISFTGAPKKYIAINLVKEVKWQNIHDRHSRRFK